MSDFVRRVDAREARVGIIGMGYVGLPLTFAFVDKGFSVIGFDIDQSKVESLLGKKSFIKHISDESIGILMDSGLFDATTDMNKLKEVEAILLCVPTPLTAQREPDMSYVISTTEAVLPHLRKDHIVILESTTYPGTTRDIMVPILERSGLKHGEDFYVAYSPEREDPANANFSTANIPKVVGGCTEEACQRASYLYGQIVSEVVPVSSTETAEAVKLTENIFRCVNIALVNELKLVFSKMDIDVWEVIDAAKTKPFGFMPFYPGPGLGGHCIPIDPFYLTWKAREFGIATRFIELAGEINVSMPEFVIHCMMEALNDQGKPLNGSKILIVGLSYKRDVDDLRESPSLVLMEMLSAKGADVDYHDPYVDVIKVTRKHAVLAGRESVDLSPEILGTYDAILIATDHSCVDYNQIVENARLVVDTRNATKDVKKGREKIVKA